MEPKAQKGLFGEELAGTKTEQNLHTALSGESQAYLRYKWFEEKAKEDGYVEISQLFHDTAANEKEPSIARFFFCLFTPILRQDARGWQG